MGKFVFKPQEWKFVVAAAASHPVQRKTIFFFMVTHWHASLSRVHTPVHRIFLHPICNGCRECDAIYSSRAHTPYCIVCEPACWWMKAYSASIWRSYHCKQFFVYMHHPSASLLAVWTNEITWMPFSWDKIKTNKSLSMLDAWMGGKETTNLLTKLPQWKRTTSLVKAMGPVNSFDFRWNRYWSAARLVSNRNDKFASPSIDW